MSFVGAFNNLSLSGLRASCLNSTESDVSRVITNPTHTLSDFIHLISPAASNRLEQLAQKSKDLTQQRFGKTIRLFAPLYLSNECINNCSYCGFSRDNPIIRSTLSIPQVIQEGEELKRQGFSNVLLVAGEHPKFVSNGYVAECIAELSKFIPSISVELGPLKTHEYIPMISGGAEGLVVYQETYDRNAYKAFHTSGPKKKFDWRLSTPERAYAAGFRRLGIGALFGLSDWRSEAIALASHALWLQKHCWKSQLTISLPRLRPCAGEFEPVDILNDNNLTQIICAFRLLLPDAGIVLSTREPANFRNGIMTLGVTLMSAGSHTEPGGYTGTGTENLHLTKKGKIIKLNEKSAKHTNSATEQFNIADHRSAATVAAHIKKMGLEPVWKDWEGSILN